MTILSRRVALVTVALLTAACTLTNTGDPSVAATVGDRSIPTSVVDENLTSIRDSDAFQQQAQGDTSGTVVLDAQTQLVTAFVRSEVLDLVAQREDIDVSDQAVAEARDQLVEQLGGDEEFRRRLEQQGVSEKFLLQQLRDQEAQTQLQRKIGADADLAQFIRSQIADVPISVNPRYGQWDADSLAVTAFEPLGGGDAQQSASESP